MDRVAKVGLPCICYDNISMVRNEDDKNKGKK